MTRAECDSTTDIFFKDVPGRVSIHGYGCTGTSAPCTSSILRLALIAGSSYALRFTTCIVNVDSSQRSRGRAPHCPYQKKRKIGNTISTECHIGTEEAIDVVSSSTDFVLPVQDSTDELSSNMFVVSPLGASEAIGFSGPFDKNSRSAGESDELPSGLRKPVP